MELMASTGQTGLYKDILSYKCHASMKPEWLMKPRKPASPTKAMETRISALVSTSKSMRVYREIYSSSRSCWKNIEPIVITRLISSIVQIQNVYYFACEEGFIECYDMKEKKFKMLLKLPVRRENCVLLIHDNCIYALGGNEYNPATKKYDKPSNLTAMYCNWKRFLSLSV